MDERPPQVTSPAKWARIERNRRLLIVAGAGAAIVALLGGGAWLLLGRAATPGPGATYTPIPGADVAGGTTAPEATSSAAATALAPGEAASTPGVDGPGVADAATCLIAYRRNGSLCVSRPDGSAEKALAVSADGVFSLSPDSRTLAYIDAKKRVLTLVDVATQKSVEVGQAALERPKWPLLSGWCAYQGAGSQPGVRRVSRDGSGAKALFAGAAPAVSADGATIVGIISNANGSTAVAVFRDGKVTTVPVSGYLIDVEVSVSRVFYAVAADDRAEAEIRSMSLTGADTVVLKSGTKAGARASFEGMCLSADGMRIAYDEGGDDGYSRLFAMDALDGGAAVSLSVRRDDYPVCWGCDGRLYFIEGNAWQGESTKLMAVGPDGLGRAVVVEGAHR